MVAMNKQINIQELLDWYMWAGVTETCSDKACLQLEQSFSTPQQELTTHKTSTNTIKIHTQSNVIKNAKDLCIKASTLSELRAILNNFEGCNLKNTAANTVFGEGCESAKIMLIGEAPGADEDRIGKPFVGRCGKLLDKMFDAIQINREECYITNVLPWRPPGNRTPTDEEISICLPFLKRQIELIKPDFVLLLGGIALKTVMDSNESISRTRGKWLEYITSDNHKIDVLATYHPSYLLRSTAQKSKVWADLIRLKIKIAEKL